MKQAHSILICLGAAGLLSACGGGGSSTTSSSTTSTTTTTVASSPSSTEYPIGLAVSSPTEATTDAVAVRAKADTLFAWAGDLGRQLRADWQRKGLGTFMQDLIIPNAYAATRRPRYAWATARIDALLDGTASPSAAFDPSKFLLQGSDAGCYGPQLAYQNNPDGAAGTGTLPTGDVGIWSETDTSTGHACAAAQLNSRMQGVSWRANQALMGLAVMLRRLYASGGTLPAAGASVNLLASMPVIPNVTWSAATLRNSTPSGTYTYTLSFTYVDGSSVSHPITLTLEHTSGSSASAYSGLLTYTVGDKFNGGNCGAGLNDVTVLGTVKYTRTSATAMNFSHRQGQYCGASVSISGKQDSSGGATSGLLLPSTTWADNFSRLGADYNPSTLQGSYIYAWQAGNGDSNSRILLVGLNGSTSDGEAYFGYGDTIQTTTGAIKGMICNWAGPGSVHTPTATEYAQRQFLQWNAGTELWTVPTGGSDIRYAPTNSCEYNGAGTFRYDRNLNGSFADETAAEINVTTPGTLAATDRDLMGKGSSATIQAAIQARGYAGAPTF